MANTKAHAFALALEDEFPQPATGEHGEHAADRHTEAGQGRLLALADALGEVPRPTLDPETKTVQRAQLIAAMETALADGSLESAARIPQQRRERGEHRAVGLGKLKPRSRWSRKLAAGGLTVGVAAGTFGGAAAASTDALPGDTLYGLKCGMENLRLTMAGNEADRGKVYLDMASTRLHEARRLMERGRGGSLDDESVHEIRRALSGMHQEAGEGQRLLSLAYKQGGDLQTMETLSEFSADHRKGWSDLRGRLPSQLTDVGRQVSSVFDAMERQVAPLQSLLPRTPGDDLPEGPEEVRGTGRHRSGDPVPSAGTPRGGPAKAPPSHGTSSPSTSSGPTGDGLLDGSRGLLDPSSPPSTAGPSDKPDTDADVEVPPLFPGILPGLGLDSGENTGQ